MSLRTMGDSCEVYRLVSDDFGRMESMTLVNTVACRKQQMSGREVQRFQGLNQSKAYICFFIVDPSIQDGDWLKVTPNIGSVAWLRVVGTDVEGSTDGRMVLWNAVGEEFIPQGTPEETT